MGGVSLRKPKATIWPGLLLSINVLQAFFTYSNIVEKYESGLSNFTNSPQVVSVIVSEQAGSVTSGEPGVTITECISALGNSITPVPIFLHVHSKSHILTGSAPGTHGKFHPSEWSNGDTFFEFPDHFIYHVRPSKNCQVHLLLDNHESHITAPGNSLLGNQVVNIPSQQYIRRGVFYVVHAESI
jgi:hypothetical protein